MNPNDKIFKSQAKKGTLMKMADDHFSIFIRRRDCEREKSLPPDVGRCFTCSKPISFKKGHCGHYAGRKHQATRYHEKNCHLQCVNCNTFNEGEHGKYARNLDKRYGQGTAETLDALKRTFCHRVRFDFMAIISEYKQKNLGGEIGPNPDRGNLLNYQTDQR